MILLLLIGCGPSVDEPAPIGGDEGTGGAPDDAGDESSSGGPEATPEMLPGLTIEDVRHGYECIDGCESFYSSESLTLTLTSDTTRTVDVELQDWALKDRTLSSDDDPIMHERVELPAGVPTTLRLRDDRDGFCSFEDWSEPVRVRLHIDGEPVEIMGHSGAGYGWDC